MILSVFISILFLPSCSVWSSLLTFCFMPYSEFQINPAFLQMLGFIDTMHFTKFTFPRNLSHMLRESVGRNCTWNEKCSLDYHRYKLRFGWNSSQKKSSRKDSEVKLVIGLVKLSVLSPPCISRQCTQFKNNSHWKPREIWLMLTWFKCKWNSTKI